MFERKIDCYILTINGDDYRSFVRSYPGLPYLIPGMSANDETCGPGKMQFALSRRLSDEDKQMLMSLPQFVSLEPEYTQA